VKAFLVRAALAAVAAFATSTVAAQSAPSDRPVTFGFAPGYEIITGLFQNTRIDNRGAALDLQLQVPLAPRRLALRGDVMFLGMDPQACPLSASRSSCGLYPLGAVISWSADVVARLNDPSKRWSPYALVGAGLYTHWASNSDPPPARAGLQGGVGFEVRPRRRSVLFAEWRYMAMGTGGVAPMTIGMRF
jgi:hypothetical protein